MQIMNSLLLHALCWILLIGLVVLNRTGSVDPKLPLLGFAIVGLLWLLLGVYSLVVGGWAWFSPSATWHAGYGVSGVLGLLPITFIVAFVVQAQRFPPIHDISTDTQMPPALNFASRVRHTSHNSTVYQASVATQQLQAYEHIQPLLVKSSPNQVLEVIKQVIMDMGWALQDVDAENRVLEATDTSAFFGFVDDVVIRVNSAGEGSRVDMRSASRIGVSDLGANAQRIEQFMAELQKRLPMPLESVDQN